MKKINKLNKQKKLLKKIIAGTTLSSVMLASGCGATSIGDYSRYDKAMISIGDKNVVVDINGFTKWRDYNIDIELADGTPMKGSSKDIRLYNSNSESMNEYVESLSPIYINEVGYIFEKKPKLDRALIQEGENYVDVPIKDYIVWDESRTILILEDGESVSINPMYLIIYSSGSSIMNEIEEKSLNHKIMKKAL